MKSFMINIYMLIFHPILFFKYTAKISSRSFLTNGIHQKIETNKLVVKKKVRFGDYTRINFYGKGKLVIGDDCYLGQRNSFLVGDDIIIGDDVLVASDVCMTSESHGINPESSEKYGKQKLIIKPIMINDGCWIGEKVVILPGVVIGKRCIIGAGSVVTKSIPDYCIAVGNPARVIKKYNFEKHIWENV